MQKPSQLSGQVETSPDQSLLEQQLLGPFDHLKEEKSDQTHQLLLDSFDWSLWKKGEALIFSQPSAEATSGGQLTLLTLTGKPLLHLDKKLPKRPAFWWDLPSGPLRDHLKKRLDVWSLQPHIGVENLSNCWACCDEEDKTLVRIECVEQALYQQKKEETPHHHQTLLKLHPLRGYDQEAHQAYQQLKPLLRKEPVRKKDAVLGSTPADWLYTCGLRPESDLLPSPLPLDPEAPTEDALRTAAARLFAQARRYEPGIVCDSDTEFLHQYRVNLRRIRSIFSLLKKALPNAVWLELKASLKQLASSTNTLRDLDVFLLERDYFLQLLPEAFRPGLEELFVKVKKERQAAQEQLSRQLLTSDYEKTCQWLEHFFAQEPLLQTPLACQPIREVADQKIWKRYLKICRQGQSITEVTSDAELHQLRIECKKLRYLLDFFASLYPPKQIKRHTKAVKRLQTLLGDFNDSAVQQQFLLARLEGKTSSDLDAALHGLITLLYQQQLQARAQIADAMQAFAAAPVKADFKSCYKNKNQ